MTTDLRELDRRRQDVKAKLMGLGNMRQGSLAERFRKCGKTQCRCAREDSYVHGPSWSLTRAVKGKTVTRIIPARSVAETRAQLAEYREFRRLAQELVDVNEKICDANLLVPEAASQEAAKKGGPKRRLKARSSPRSKHS